MEKIVNRRGRLLLERQRRVGLVRDGKIEKAALGSKYRTPHYGGELVLWEVLSKRGKES